DHKRPTASGFSWERGADIGTRPWSLTGCRKIWNRSAFGCSAPTSAQMTHHWLCTREVLLGGTALIASVRLVVRPPAVWRPAINATAITAAPRTFHVLIRR